MQTKPINAEWLESIGGRIVENGVAFGRIYFDSTDGIWAAYLSTKHPANYLNQVPNRSNVLSLFAALGITNHTIEMERKATLRTSCETPNVVNTCKSAIVCNHANESPLVCLCHPDCYCRREGNCFPKAYSPGWGMVTEKGVEQLTSKELNLEADPGFKARALHRIVRSMHDGHCPKCGHLGTSESFYFTPIQLLREGKHGCPKCGFTVTDKEAEAALAEFLPYLKKSVDIFEEWRKEL